MVAKRDIDSLQNRYGMTHKPLSTRHQSFYTTGMVQLSLKLFPLVAILCTKDDSLVRLTESGFKSEDPDPLVGQDEKSVSAPQSQLL